MDDVCEKKKEEVISVASTRNHSHLHASIIDNSSNSLESHHGTSAQQPHGMGSIVSPSSNVDNDEMYTPTPLISHSQSNSSRSNVVPTVPHSPHDSSHMENVSGDISTMTVDGLTEKKVRTKARFR